jgi:hypothetical protein
MDLASVVAVVVSACAAEGGAQQHGENMAFHQ